MDVRLGANVTQVEKNQIEQVILKLKYQGTCWLWMDALPSETSKDLYAQPLR